MRAEGAGRLSAVAFGAGVASTVITVVALAFQIGLAMASGGQVQPALVGTMGVLFTVANVPLAVMLIAVAVVSFRNKAFPAWLGWLAADLPYPLYVVWLAAATTVMVTRLGRPTQATMIPDTPRQLIDQTPQRTG
jgi:hypothetical protein